MALPGAIDRGNAQGTWKRSGILETSCRTDPPMIGILSRSLNFNLTRRTSRCRRSSLGMAKRRNQSRCRSAAMPFRHRGPLPVAPDQRPLRPSRLPRRDVTSPRLAVLTCEGRKPGLVMGATKSRPRVDSLLAMRDRVAPPRPLPRPVPALEPPDHLGHPLAKPDSGEFNNGYSAPRPRDENPHGTGAGAVRGVWSLRRGVSDARPRRHRRVQPGEAHRRHSDHTARRRTRGCRAVGRGVLGQRTLHSTVPTWRRSALHADDGAAGTGLAQSGQCPPQVRFRGVWRHDQRRPGVVPAATAARPARAVSSGERA